MKLLLSLLCMVVIARAAEVDVYLLGGQSNMQGLGSLSELTSEQKAAPSNVYYWTGSTYVPLVPGSTVTAAAGQFGPEIAFAAEISRRGRTAYLIKYYDGGKPLDSGWNDQAWVGDPPAPNRVNFYPGISASDPNQGVLYKNSMLPRYRAGIQALVNQGHTPNVRGLIWMQGEQDSKQALSAGRYPENLKRLRDRLASDLALPSLPVVFGQVLPREPWAARFAFRNEIRSAMAQADMGSGSEKAIPQCRMVSTDGFPVSEAIVNTTTGERDWVHYTAAGQLALGKSFAVALNRLLGMEALAEAPLYIGFHNSTATRDAMAPGSAPMAQGVRVNTSNETWNHVWSSATSTFSLGTTGLTTATGKISGAMLSGTSGYAGGNSNGWAAENKDSVMMEGWFGFAGSGELLKVSNLPPSFADGFKVIVYGDINVARTMNYTIGGLTRTIQDNGSLFSGAFTEGAHYVEFTGLTGTSFTLTGNTVTPRSAVNGIAIVPTPLPPSVSTFQVNDRYVSPGTIATLSWQTTRASTVSISGLGEVAPAGSLAVPIHSTTIYTITATNAHGTVSQEVKVSVGPERPNVVFFMVDDMGWQDTSVPFYYDAAGHPVVTGFNQRYRTPNMEALAASGRKFTNAYAAAICSPSRTSLMTGQSSARHHVTNWTLYPDLDQSGTSATLKSPLDWAVNGLAPMSDTTSTRVWRTDVTLPRLLQNAGYKTIHVGKAHFGADSLPGEDPIAQGFEVNIGGHAAGGPGSYLGTANYGSGIWQVPGLEAYHGSDTFLSEALTREANKSLEQAVADGAPFFLHMAHYAIHVPLALDPRFQSNYPGVDATETKYATLIEGMDKSLGDIRAKLEELGVAENTLIIFYSDNGGLSASARGLTPAGTGANTHNKPLRAGKGSAYEGGTRVPAIVAWAKADAGNVHQLRVPIPASSRGEKPFIIEDLFPSVLDIAGVSKPQEIDGVSVVNYFTNQPGFERDPSFIFHVPHIWEPAYIGQNQGYEMHSSLREGNWKVIHYYENSRWELYNLADDLGEANNLAASRQDLVFQLGRKLIRKLREYGVQYPVYKTTNVEKAPILPDNTSVDSDADGVADVMEDVNRNGLVDAGETDAGRGDTDGDGVSDGAERKIGTNALDPTQTFFLTPQVGASGSMEITWPSKSGATFTIQSSMNLESWTEEGTGVPAAPDPATKTRRDLGPPASARRFYRVLLE